MLANGLSKVHHLQLPAAIQAIQAARNHFEVEQALRQHSAPPIGEEEQITRSELFYIRFQANNLVDLGQGRFELRRWVLIQPRDSAVQALLFDIDGVRPRSYAVFTPDLETFQAGQTGPVLELLQDMTGASFTQRDIDLVVGQARDMTVLEDRA